MLDTVFGENSNSVTAQSLLGVLKNLDVTGTLYLGYPVLSTADGKVFIDGLLLSQAYGLVAFDLSVGLDAHPTTAQLDGFSERQNQIYASIYNKLNTHSDLRKGRNLGTRYQRHFLLSGPGSHHPRRRCNRRPARRGAGDHSNI